MCFKNWEQITEVDVMSLRGERSSVLELPAALHGKHFRFHVTTACTIDHSKLLFYIVTKLVKFYDPNKIQKICYLIEYFTSKNVFFRLLHENTT